MLSLCLTEPMLASTQTDLLLTKAEPIGDSGSTLLMVYIRDRKNCCGTAAEERGVRMCKRKTCADMEIHEERDGSGVRAETLYFTSILCFSKLDISFSMFSNHWLPFKKHDI